MKIFYILSIFTILLFTQNVSYSMSFSFDPADFMPMLLTKPAILTSENFSKLRTTYIPGVYCQQKDDFGGYRKQKHYFYNTQKEQMIEIPGLYYITSENQLRKYRKEYELYGAKSDTFTHKGKTYTIRTF